VKGNGVGEPISNFTPARPTSVKSLAGDFVYGYDEANPALLTKMTGPAHSVETSYEPHRNLVTGVVNRVLIQSAARRTDEDTKGKVVSSYTYSNDLLGRRETISQGGEAFGMLKLGHNQVEVAYNDRSEVVGAVYRSGDEARQTFDYAYDAIGNRRTAVSSRVTGQESREEKVSYETNALNQYTAIDERSSSNPKSEIGNPKFDPDGNLLEDARNTYTWNADNTLIRVDAKDGSLRLDYVYDHQSRRTVRIETKQPGTKNEEQRTTYYLYEAWNLLAEIDAVPAGGELGTLNFEPAALFSWGRDLSGSLQGAGGVGGLLAISKVSRGADERGEAQLKTLNLKLETLFPTYDANGNVGQLIDADGTVVAAYAYDPFGNVTEMAGAEASENPWRFSTKPVEEGTGWLYYGYRWYDAGMGRWPSRDPIEERGGLNLYVFNYNLPTILIDVLGNFSSVTTPAGAKVCADITAMEVGYGVSGVLVSQVVSATKQKHVERKPEFDEGEDECCCECINNATVNDRGKHWEGNLAVWDFTISVTRVMKKAPSGSGGGFAQMDWWETASRLPSIYRPYCGDSNRINITDHPELMQISPTFTKWNSRDLSCSSNRIVTTDLSDAPKAAAAAGGRILFIRAYFKNPTNCGCTTKSVVVDLTQSLKEGARGQWEHTTSHDVSKW
jgi:RHS repeat-associated protein